MESKDAKGTPKDKSPKSDKKKVVKKEKKENDDIPELDKQQPPQVWWKSEDEAFPSEFALDGKFSFAARPQTFYPVLAEPRETEKDKSAVLDALRINVRRDPKHELWQSLKTIPNVSPDLYRVDAAGNALFRKAPPEGPLGWDIDHAFPWSRGGLTVVSNLHLLHSVANRHVKNDELWHVIPLERLLVGLPAHTLEYAIKSGSFFGVSSALLNGQSLSATLQTAQDSRLFDLLDLALLNRHLRPDWLKHDPKPQDDTVAAFFDILKEYNEEFEGAEEQRSYSGLSARYGRRGTRGQMFSRMLAKANGLVAVRLA